MSEWMCRSTSLGHHRSVRHRLAYDDRPWPSADGQLVHAAFGLRPWRAAAVPLEERDLPAAFTHLDEDVQADRIESVLRTVFTWAGDHGADQVEVALLEPDEDGLARLGLQPAGAGTLAGAFAVKRLLPLL